MRQIHVSVCQPGHDIAGPWTDLVQRAACNVFMHPLALNAAHGLGFAQIRALLAWDGDAGNGRLVGLWALQEMSMTPVGPSFLAAPAFDYAFLSNPVIDPAVADDTTAAFLAAIEADRSLPNVVRLRYLDASAESYPALLKALGERGGHALTISARERPFATREFGIKRSGSTRKKMRQDWNRLSALGTVDVVNDRAPDAVRGAFEGYLIMEAESWKGAHGTALLCDEEDAAFTRRLIADLAADRSASVALLRIDGRAVAAQVLLYCGRTAYTWKTAFDAEYAKFSPGALLIDKISEQLFAEDGIEAIESCSTEGGFMNQLWEGRRATVDLLVDVGVRKSLSFSAVAASERGYLQLRTLRNRLRAVNWPMLPKRRRLAASR